MCELNRGSLDQIMNGQKFEGPILQLLDYRKIQRDASDQYRLLVSDGVKMNRFTMLSTELNYLFENNTFAKYAVFKVLNYIVTLMNEERKVLIIMGVDVLKSAKEIQGIIGNPTENEIENPTENRIENPTENKIKNPTKNKIENPTKNKIKSPTKIKIKNPTENKIKNPTENKIENPTKNKIKSPTKIKIKNPTENKIENPTENKIKSPTKIKIENPTENEIENLAEMNKPDLSTVVHHEVIEDTMQPSTSRYINNSFSEESTIPINIVSPRKRDAIKARVFDKSPIKEWNKNNRSGKWFSVQLVDNSDKIRCIAFDDDCNKFHNNLENNKVYMFSNYMVELENQQYSKSQNGYQIKFTKNTIIEECLDDASTQSIPFAQYGHNDKLLTFQEATEKKLGENLQNTDFFTVVATIDSIRSYIYKACPICKKKLQELSYDKFKCIKCDKETHFNYGLTLKMDISDPTGSYNVTAFNKIAEDILNTPIQTLGELNKNDYDAYIEKINEIILKRYIFTLKGKAEDFNGYTTAKYICASIKPLNHLTYLKHLMSKINEINLN